MNPTVGRIVHYFSDENDLTPQAAIVVKVNNDNTVNLQVFSSSSSRTYIVQNVAEAITSTYKRWTWPPLA